MSFSGQSNAPWQRNVMQVSSFHQQGQTRPGPPQQMFLQQAPQQTNMAFHGGIQAGGIFPPGSGAVSYPQPRSTGLNPVAFQQVAGAGSGGGQSQHYNSIGTVTKINSDCGLVNNEVFFYRNVCKGHAPKLGDRVLFEATYSSSGQFKWNATRIQLMPQQSHQPPPLMGSNVVAGNVSNKSGSGYNAVPPPNEYRGPPQHHRHNSPRRSSPGRERDRHARNDRDHRERERTHRSRDRDDDEHDRKRRREDRSRERISSTSRSGATAVVRNERGAADRERDAKLDRKDRERERERERERDRDREREKERSPHRAVIKGRRARTIRRYMVQIPKSILAYTHADVQELRQRYNTLYIPSDFFHANIKWSESFTLENPFPLSRPCQFHIMHKIVEPPFEQEPEETEPADADYLYSAKVMLMSCPPIADIYQKCFEDDDSDNEQHTVHPSRLIGFLVGTRGRNEPMAIGGPWSPSLDGENPDKDPAVLIRTAIRTCKALTGIDLSNCTQWYRFKELFYHRTDNKHKDKDAPPRIETVVVYLPDVHSCMPSATAWQNLTQSYKTAVENVIARRTAACKASVAVVADDNSTTGAANNNSNADTEREADADGDGEDDGEVAAEAEVVQAESATAGDDDGDDDDVTIIEEVDEPPTSSSVKGAAAADDGVAESTKDVAADGDQNETEKDDSTEPTHYSQLDLKTMKVPEIRNELIARNLPSKGVRNLIMARLAKAINAEKADEVNWKKASAKKTKPIAKKVEEMEVDTADTKQANETETSAEEAQEDQGEDEPENDANENENDDNEDWTDVIDVDMSDIVILDEYDSSKNPEETPKEMDEKEKSQLIRRYTLPPSTPQIIVHPNKTAKGGKFDCSVMTLSVLLDYRPEDTKERFFEVSLFAELFNEMLMRDFGFNIYKELYVYKESIIAGESAANESKNEDTNNKKDEAGDPEEDEKAKESTENKSNSDEASEKSARGRRTSKRSVDEEPEDDNQSAKSSADRKRKSTTSTSGRDKDKDMNSDKKMVVVKPQLLLSFVYFDTSHCGYIFEKDLEDLFSILGLNLSRGQIRKVLGKLATRQAFYYRKLTDKEETLETMPTIEDADDISIEELKKIALGNRQFESVFNNNTSGPGVSPISDENDGFINHNGAVVHVGKLVAQIKRTEKNYSDLEKLYNDIRRQHTDLQKDHSKSSGKIKDLQSEVKSLNRKLSDTDQGFSSINRKYRDQQSTLSYIYNRVAPYFSREKDKDHKSEGGRDKDADKDKDKEKYKDSKDNREGKDNKDKERNKDLKDEEANRKDGEKEKNVDKEKDESKSEVKDVENSRMVDENSKDDIKKE